MRVLFVAPVAVAGGVSEVLRALTAPRERRPYEPSVLFLRPGPAVQRLCRPSGTVDCIDVGRMRSPIAVGRGVRSVAGRLRRLRPDVVVGLEPSAQIYVALPARRLGIPVVWQQHAAVDPRSIVGRVARSLPAAAAVANSEYVALGMRSRTRCPVVVVRPGVDTRRMAAADGRGPRRSIGLSDDDPLVGIVGRLQPWKGQHLFLRAVAGLVDRHPAARFVIVGGAEMGWERGDYPEQLRVLARRLGLGDRVTFTGQVDDAAEWIAACDVVVSASDAEPYGLVVCEAQAAGTAVVAVASGGPLELIEHGVDGVLCDRDAASLRAAIDRLLADDELRATIGRAGAARARAQHDAQRMTTELGRLLREVAA